MTTRGKAISEVAHRLGNRTDLNTRILNTMGYVQRFVCEKYAVLPWFLITENLYTDTTIGEPRIEVPERFMREVETGALWRERTPDDADERLWDELTKHPHDSLRAELGGVLDAQGTPKHYALLGKYWILAPIPDAVYRIYTRIYQQDVLPVDLASDTTTNRWITNEFELLVAETVLRLGRHLRFTASDVREFRSDRDEARRQFFVTHEAREHTNIRYRMAIARGN